MEHDAKEQIAQEKYGKSFEELSTNEQKAVGGTYGGNTRKEQMAEAKGGDVSAAYSEMSKTQYDSAEEREKAHSGGGDE